MDIRFTKRHSKADRKEQHFLHPDQTLPQVGGLMTENNLNVTDLVRSLQRSSGEQDCFRRGESECDRVDCLWRDLCLGWAGPGADNRNKPE